MGSEGQRHPQFGRRLPRPDGHHHHRCQGSYRSVGVMTAVKKKSGFGTVVALMLLYSTAILAVWTVLFVLWFLLGIPLGPGYPPNVP